jgi:quercetin dioxygenase-like cupin family protein
MSHKQKLAKSRSVVLAGVAAVLCSVAAYAAVNEIIAFGTIADFGPLGGPAAVTVRRLTIAPGEVLGWHAHPGIGAYTIVNKGTLTVEDGCGTEDVYSEHQAFFEQPFRVHRGKNLTTSPVETVQTFVVVPGDPISEPEDQACGSPLSKDECRAGGWSAFTFPRPFANQGDCEQFVITGK